MTLLRSSLALLMLASLAYGQTALQAGATNVTRYVVLRDSTALTVETGYTITSLDLQYTRNRSTPAAKVDATALSSTNDAHSDNQAIEVDGTSSPGLYRVDWPDAAFATGSDKVMLVVSGTGLDPYVEEIQLVDYDADQSFVKEIFDMLNDESTTITAITDAIEDTIRQNFDTSGP